MIKRIFSISVIAILVAFSSSSRANENIPLTSLFGSFVGYAGLMDANQEVTERREMDIIISPYEVTGFHIRWINVTLKDGRRDWQGVTRRSTEVGFVPSDYGSFYVRDGAYDPFRTKDKFQPYLGSPVQWALLDEVGLHVYSFVIDDNGKFELQRYSRTLEDGRMHLEFERLDDGLVTRSIKGEAVRAETE